MSRPEYVEPEEIGNAAMELWHLPNVTTTALQFRLTLEIVDSESGEVLCSRVWPNVDLWP